MVCRLERLQLLLASVPKLARFFKSLFCFLGALEASDGTVFTGVGVSIVVVKADSLLEGCQRFLVTLEVIEGIAFEEVGVGGVGVKADDLLVGCQRFLVTLEVI